MMPPDAVIKHFAPERNKGNGAHPPPPGVRVYWDEDEDEIPAQGWLVRKILQARGAAMLAGQSGLCKTYLVLDLALACILGTDFMGQPVERKGGVLFFAAEAPELILRRWRALKKAKAAPWFEQQAGDGRAIPKLPFGRVSAVPSLTATDALAQMAGVCEQVQHDLRSQNECDLVLVIVDTLMAAATFKDPNDAGEAQRVMNTLNLLAQKANSTVLVVDHFGKDPDRGVRGSSAKEAALYTVLSVLGKKDSNTGVATDLQIVVTKSKTSGVGLRASFNLAEVQLGADEYGEPVNDMVVHWTENVASKRASNNKRYAALLTAMDEALDAYGRWQIPAAGWPRVHLVESRWVRQFFGVAYPPTPDEKTRKKTIDRAYQRAMSDSKDHHIIGSFAPDTGDVLVWKVDQATAATASDSSSPVAAPVRERQQQPLSLREGLLSPHSVAGDADLEF